MVPGEPVSSPKYKWYVLIVEIDSKFHQVQAKHARIKINVLLRISGYGRNVMDSQYVCCHVRLLPPAVLKSQSPGVNGVRAHRVSKVRNGLVPKSSYHNISLRPAARQASTGP